MCFWVFFNNGNTICVIYFLFALYISRFYIIKMVLKIIYSKINEYIRILMYIPLFIKKNEINTNPDNVNIFYISLDKIINLNTILFYSK